MNQHAHLKSILILLTLAVCMSCQDTSSNIRNQTAYKLGAVGAFSEIIQAGVKQLALSSPLSPDEMDRFIEEATRIAADHGVSVYRESELIQTDLFPKDIVEGKDVLVLYKGHTLDQYKALKADQQRLQESDKYDRDAQLEISRRFGRMLSYSAAKINDLLAANTEFRTMQHFGIQASNIFLYYRDLNAAATFYIEVLGMEDVADYGMARILRMTTDTYLILVDATKGMHTADEPKTVALALLTDNLPGWYDHLKSNNVEIKYDYKPKDGGAHDGFVAIDPEGYLLEFETFKEHPENELFVPILTENLAQAAPRELTLHSTITWLYYKNVLEMQYFFEDVLGLEMVADQGWTKIYQVSNTGFLAIVDERRGMHSFTEKKAVNVSFFLEDLEGWYNYTSEHKPFELRNSELGIGPETRYKAFVGYDPEGYYLEFDKFFPHADNERLLEHLTD